jgi:hypothetical protein
MISQPAALNKASTFRHSILPETGSVNTAARLLLWVRFITYMVSFFATMSRRLILAANTTVLFSRRIPQTLEPISQHSSTSNRGNICLCFVWLRDNHCPRQRASSRCSGRLNCQDGAGCVSNIPCLFL